MYEQIKDIVSEVAEVNINEIDETTDFVDDLEIDSMMALEIMTEIEKKFEIDIPDSELPNFSNIEELVSIIERNKGG